MNELAKGFYAMGDELLRDRIKRTIFVVGFCPGGQGDESCVGGFEWRLTAKEALDALADLLVDDRDLASDYVLRRVTLRIVREDDHMISDETPMQESAEKKAAWLEWAKRKFPLGKRVRVMRSNCDGGEVYVGSLGAVSDYDIGCDGEWPMVQITFDAPINGQAHDAFYADGSDAEIVAE